MKFSTRGGRVQVLLERVNSHLEVSVIDDGEGIPPEFLPHVFDRFRQADGTTTRKHGGPGPRPVHRQATGRTARRDGAGQESGRRQGRDVHRHAAADADPRGAGRGRGAAAPQAAPVSTALGDDACVKLRGLHVLVVDDEPDARALVKRLLENCEAVVATAGSAADALDMVLREVPDVLVSDIGMPGEDGYSLIGKVRSMTPAEGGEVPAVALTAYARSEDRTRAMLAGFNAHVSKPVEPAELVATIAGLARRAGAGRRLP